MKRILFIIPSFGIGGTTVSTRHLISIIDKSKYKIEVLSLNSMGSLYWMYDDVSLIKTDVLAQALSLESWSMEKVWYRRLFAALIRFVSNHSTYVRRMLMRMSIKKTVINKTYDTVVACQEGITTEYVSYIPVKNKIAWVRCDYARYLDLNGRLLEPFYSDFAQIVCVSNQTYKTFIEVYPCFGDRTISIYNAQDSSLIKSQAEINDLDPRYHKDAFTLMSVGRLDKVKRFDKIPIIAKQLIDMGLEFVWYIVGDGIEKSKIINEIQKYNIENYVILLGSKTNPLYYIKSADLYVCLSLSEACPRVINEAKILGTPVISTDFASVHEYITNNVSGLVASMDDIPNAIYKLATDQNLYNRIKETNEDFVFDNSEIMSQLEKIL